MLVVLDSRGTGLSDRRTPGFGLDAQAADLEAVVDQLELDRFALMGNEVSGPASIAFSVNNPGRVAHLVLWGCFVSGRDWIQSAFVDPFRALAERDWVVFAEALARRTLGWSNEGLARPLVKVIQDSSSSDTVKQALADISSMDITSLLSEVNTPTLVLQPRIMPYPDLAVARLLATRIPKPESTEGGRRVSVLKRQEGAPVNLG